MLSLAKTVFTNFITPVTVNYEIVANKPFHVVAFINDHKETIAKIEELVCQDGYHTDGVYFINKNGVNIQYFDNGRFDVRLTGESMKDVMEIYLKTMLVENTSYQFVKSTQVNSVFNVTGDIVSFIESLSKDHGFVVDTTEVSEYNYIHEVKTNLFNMIIDEQNDVLEVSIFY